MRRPLAALATLAFTAILWGCGSDAKEEAPASPTGDALAQAPPNAVGADVERPAATIGAANTIGGPTPVGPGTKIKPKVTAEPDIPDEPDMPVPPTTTATPKKGTQL